MAIKVVNISSVCQRFVYLVLVCMAACSKPVLMDSDFNSLQNPETEAFYEAWWPLCQQFCGLVIGPMVRLACFTHSLMSRTRTPFLEKPYSAMFLSNRLAYRLRPGIISECCYMQCTIEEYANYCIIQSEKLEHDNVDPYCRIH
ncbi:uncharacterized protein LOC121375753 [Gigantopelta aegis]|uniref:uncharacterized protein LOC121375753 n=1 Tax=Gigantopelta aegis TaxID=1735272 RepID=UPI001B888A68|nr:uncharacterized protein LOC121375753 [Gigantopelta aegis]